MLPEKCRHCSTHYAHRNLLTALGISIGFHILLLSLIAFMFGEQEQKIQKAKPKRRAAITYIDLGSIVVTPTPKSTKSPEVVATPTVGTNPNNVKGDLNK